MFSFLGLATLPAWLCSRSNKSYYERSLSLLLFCQWISAGSLVFTAQSLTCVWNWGWCPHEMFVHFTWSSFHTTCMYLRGVLQLDFHFVLFASCKFVGGSLERFASQWAEIRVSCFSQQGFLKPANWLLLKTPSEWFWFREGPQQESNLGDLHSQERVTLAEASLSIMPVPFNYSQARITFNKSWLLMTFTWSWHSIRTWEKQQWSTFKVSLTLKASPRQLGSVQEKQRLHLYLESL